MLSRQNVVGITGLIENLEKSSPSIKQNDVGYLAVQAPDGTYHETEKMEWWGSFAFSSKCSDEEENRFMDFGNWILSTDNMETAAYGIKGVDWNQDSSGKITLNWPFDASGNPSFSQNISKAYVGWDQTVQKWFVLEGFDVYLPGNPVYSNYVKNAFKDVMTIEKKNLTLQTNDYNVDFFSAPDKNQYGNFSNDAIDAITKAVASPDPGKSWNDFVSSIQPKLNSVLNEINKGVK